MKNIYSSFVLGSFLSISCSAAFAKNDITLWPKQKPAIEKNAALEADITRLINKMSLEQKVGQMVQAEITPHKMLKNTI